ncbi:MAG TPA: DUF6089 family protein [Prolixibacteraceae bacterium]|nr:DUF6089 family protein [Prolixibacteraceae bacterium]
MKQFIIVFLIALMVFKAQAQPSLDIGFFGGAGTYFGDMTKVDFSKSVNPAYGAFVRYNFNPRYALRFNVLNGTIGADGEFDNQLWTRNPETGEMVSEWSFDKNVMDISLQFEWNFFKYIVGDKETPHSTYIFGGVGMQNYEFSDFYAPPGGPNSEVAATIPFGLGFKFNLSRRIGLGFEGGLRKTFSDKLDNLDDPLGYPSSEPKYTDSYHNNDWTAYAGIHLVYKLFYGYKEWELTTPKKRILDWGIQNNPNNR